MIPALFTKLVYARWLLIIIYLTALGTKREPRGHVLQSFRLLFALIAAFLLPPSSELPVRDSPIFLRTPFLQPNRKEDMG
jgi:hypothetical protein